MVLAVHVWPHPHAHSQALDEEVSVLRSALEARVDTLEGDVRQAGAQLELHAQVG